jgi:hypothetical protein
MGSRSSRSRTPVGGAPWAVIPYAESKKILKSFPKGHDRGAAKYIASKLSRRISKFSKRSNWNALRRSIASSTIGRSVAARCTIKGLATADLGENCPPKLSRLKPAEKWLYDFDSRMLEQALADLQRAYVHFFAKRAKFLKFKNKEISP